MEYLETRDPFRRAVMQMVAREARTIQRRIDRERANLHAAEIMKMLSAGFKKR